MDAPVLPPDQAEMFLSPRTGRLPGGLHQILHCTLGASRYLQHASETTTGAQRLGAQQRLLMLCLKSKGLNAVTIAFSLKLAHRLCSCRTSDFGSCVASTPLTNGAVWREYAQGVMWVTSAACRLHHLQNELQSDLWQHSSSIRGKMVLRSIMPD